MKKAFLFTLSFLVAFGITFYTKKTKFDSSMKTKPEWKTFVKKSHTEIVAYKTTNEEFKAAKIPTQNQNSQDALPKARPGRSIASVSPFKGFMVRNNRILMGDVDQKYEDENIKLRMVNEINPDWKDIMGQDLMRFQPEDTKLMVKEEVPVIKIKDGQGRFLEQVTITYLQKNGSRSSFKALVDSGTGSVVETWDRTIHEEIRRPREGIFLPSVNESGIVTK